jgi:predicted ATPase
MPSASNNVQTFPNLEAVAKHLRGLDKKVTLIFAYNGTGKTRLSMAFKELGKQRNAEGDVIARDTLYFNAFTEDLFTWDNDLENDRERVLKMNTSSRFFAGLEELEMESRIRRFLNRYADYQFEINYQAGTIRFWRETRKNDNGESEPVLIKVSRGEENMFIWCFFLAIAQLAIDGQGAYDWVKYLYIDDPISSLDENNAIAVAAHLAKMLKEQDQLKAVISSTTRCSSTFCAMSSRMRCATSSPMTTRATTSATLPTRRASTTWPCSRSCIRPPNPANFIPITSPFCAAYWRKPRPSTGSTTSATS